MVGDNCSVNQCICKKDGTILLVECASLKFNLMSKDFFKIEDELITKLRTIKDRMNLRRVSHLSPLLRNNTRWSSTYEMVKSYVTLQLVIVHQGQDLLAEYDAITKALQKYTLKLSAFRRLFDKVIKKFPTRMAATAPIANNPNLEYGLAKLPSCPSIGHQKICDSDNSIVKAVFKKRKTVKRSYTSTSRMFRHHPTNASVSFQGPSFYSLICGKVSPVAS
ncbi:Hypothetical protein PHPALM_11538 [Phytophthora palmivora]|uniref:Uncharacterized protein n=1 Tax=Phytophthora palmivora TaxID=4796 RepID=A0A2P4Y207_9STRA|nr:Hypothetical protein PHPALM_11538 [Phytophthora palmivora]